MLDGANLQRANLIGANLLDASLKGADLQGSDLRETQIIFKEEDIVISADLMGTKVNNATQWPEGFAPPNTTIYMLE